MCRSRDHFCAHRGASFKEDEGTWKGNDDGKVVNNQPQRVMDDRNGLGPQGGYIAKITNDARETEMEENMGQVNTMIGNLRNMAIDMGSELENQNRQIDRINRKVGEDGDKYYASECTTVSAKLHRNRAIWHGSKPPGDPRHRTSTRCKPWSRERGIFKNRRMFESGSRNSDTLFRGIVYSRHVKYLCTYLCDGSFTNERSFCRDVDLLLKVRSTWRCANTLRSFFTSFFLP